MRRATRISVALSAAVLALGAAAAVQAQQSNMTFFVTSAGLGKGADLGGLDGADAHCNALAKAAGSKLTNWRAYLSTTKPGGDAGDNARDRIGKGPWRNAKGVVIAKNVERPALGQQQDHQADGADREGRGGGWPRRPGQHARHPDRLRPARPLLDGRRRHHLRQLDQERRRFGHRRPS